MKIVFRGFYIHTFPTIFTLFRLSFEINFFEHRRERTDAIGSFESGMDRTDATGYLKIEGTELMTFWFLNVEATELMP